MIRKKTANTVLTAIIQIYIAKANFKTFHELKLFRNTENSIREQELIAHMVLVTRQEELRAKRSYGMSSNKILRINRWI